jgi:hypothetical protein
MADINLSPLEVRRIMGVISSGQAEKGFQQAMIQALRGKPIEEIVKLLGAVEQVAPVAAKLLQRAAHALRTMPVVKLAAMLGGEQPKTSKPASPARKKALNVQGRYLGLLRGFPDGRVRAKIKEIAKQRGVPAAIHEMESIRKAAKGKH